MPVSVYLRAGLFVVAVGAALFAAAGTVAIPGFWVYLAIFAAVMIVSFAALDPDLLRERMRRAVRSRRSPCGSSAATRWLSSTLAPTMSSFAGSRGRTTPIFMLSAR